MFEWIDINDIIDIVIVSMLIYAGLVWFKRTRAFLVVVGIVILGLVYALARYFNLFLTTAILQGFFAVLLIAVIVIFQEELRHFFERVALWGLGRHKVAEPRPMIGTIVFAASELARSKTGAIIVIAGRDPLERHIEGGILLDGDLSEYIIRGIFNKNSPCHDGALIIENGRLQRFSAHLPLSKELEKLSGKGTRHAAALGLSERCDALCIVVSEERGVISVAKDGELHELRDSAELGNILSGFLREKFPPRSKRRISNLARHNLREKAIAVVLSLGLWATFAYRAGVVQRDFVVPVEYSNLPDGFMIEKAEPRKLTVILSGDERAFRLLDANGIRATVDITGAKEGRQKIPVTQKAVSGLQRNIILDGVRPEEIDVTLKRNGEKH